jgi:hypothetical protein
MQVSIWLADGSVYQNVTVTRSDLKVDSNAIDIGNLSKIDSAFVYTVAGAKIYRGHADGTIQIAVEGETGSVTIKLAQIADLIRNDK